MFMIGKVIRLHAELTLYQMKTEPWLKESSYANAAIQRVVSDKNLPF